MPIVLDELFAFLLLVLVGGATAHLVGQLATSRRRSEVRIPVRATSIFHCSCVHPALNGKLGLLRPGESKGGEESNGKLPHNAVCQEQSGPFSWLPDA
ncbi:hypothetical protein PoB_004477000 [Plakobranchus ocellatus]|uniref:Secreted protein n=1 Tax=Plakobranchus ocellatus TaxID=259542 RepID=A0AAV4BCB6_9GAST|nr:hypothetical protein PoB_004477000 [Plakobranchus ocellatus]